MCACRRAHVFVGAAVCEDDVTYVYDDVTYVCGARVRGCGSLDVVLGQQQPA